MDVTMVTYTRHREKHLDIKTRHGKRKTKFLKEIVKNITSRRPLIKKVENVQTFSEIKWRQKLTIERPTS